MEAAILSGGTSRRMGENKAWLRLREPDGPTLIENLVALLEPDYHPVRILPGAASGQSYASLGVAVQHDLRPGLGPLGGIHTALATARRDVVLILACDLPFLTRELLGGLSLLLRKYQAVVPCPSGRAMPLCAFYSTGCLPALEARLERGALKTTDFLEDLAVRWVEGPELARLDPTGTALFNLNTPGDLERAKAIALRR